MIHIPWFSKITPMIFPSPELSHLACRAPARNGGRSSGNRNVWPARGVAVARGAWVVLQGKPLKINIYIYRYYTHIYIYIHTLYTYTYLLSWFIMCILSWYTNTHFSFHVTHLDLWDLCHTFPRLEGHILPGWWFQLIWPHILVSWDHHPK